MDNEEVRRWDEPYDAVMSLSSEIVKNVFNMELPDICFFDDKGNIFDPCNKILPERFNMGPETLGLYKPGTGKAFIRITDIWQMVATICHESAHHNLIRNTIHGKRLYDWDYIVELDKYGLTQISDEDMEKHSPHFYISHLVNEGFAEWVEIYALRYIIDCTERELDLQKVDLANIMGIIHLYKTQVHKLDGEPDTYRHGRKIFTAISDFFGPISVFHSAFAAMNINCDVECPEHLAIVEEKLVSEMNDMDLENIKKSFFITPNLRFLAFGKVLPYLAAQRNPVTPKNNIDYFTNIVLNTLGENFLKKEITDENLKEIKDMLSTEEQITNDHIIQQMIGEIMGDIVAGEEMIPLLERLMQVEKDFLGPKIYDAYRSLGEKEVKNICDDYSKCELDPMFQVGYNVARLQHAKRKDRKKFFETLANIHPYAREVKGELELLDLKPGEAVEEIEKLIKEIRILNY